MTMDDRTLLEKAAKAANVFLTPKTMDEVFPGFVWNEEDAPVFTDQGASGTVAWRGDDGELAGTKRQDWNPLQDDGDALRLAVKLDISLWQAGDSAVADHDALGPKMREPHNGDRYAATRRAIVRAAAAMADSTAGE